MKPRKIMLRDEVRWVVQSCAGGQRRRFYFKTKPLAEQKARQLVEDRAGFGSVWLELEPRERAEVCAILAEMRGRSVKPREVWEAFKRGDVRGVVASVKVEAAITAMVAAKRGENLRENYLTDLVRCVRQFAAGRTESLVSAFTKSDVEAFIAAPASPNTRSTRRGRMLAFFSFCHEREWTAGNVAAGIKKPKVDRQPPRILSIAECRALLAYVEKEQPHALGWFVLGLFAGIRPEECDVVRWADVDFDRGKVRLKAETHKTRKGHTVELPANAFAWLVHAQEIGAEQPIAHTTRRRAQRLARVALGLAAWPQDVLRHTFCSYGSAHLGHVATARIAHHSESVLERHYKDEVTLQDAKEFFSIEPKESKCSPPKISAPPAKWSNSATPCAPSSAPDGPK